MRSLKIATICLLAVSVIGCAGTQINITPEQQDALARLAGNAIAITLSEVKPQYLPAAQTFCGLFNNAQNIIEAKTVFESALTFLSSKYVDNPALGKVLINALNIIGFSEGQVNRFIAEGVDSTVKIDNFTEEMYRKTSLVATGFCEVLPQ